MGTWGHYHRVRAVDDGIALAESSFAASRPSIKGGQPKSRNNLPCLTDLRTDQFPLEANRYKCHLHWLRYEQQFMYFRTSIDSL